MSRGEPQRMIAARRGSPLVIGLGIGENFIASDVFALLPVTQRFIFLEDGDIADITREAVTIYDESGNIVTRPETISELSADAAEKSGYRHFMLKEIFTQPRAVSETLEGRIEGGTVPDSVFGIEGTAVLDSAKSVTIVACGTSYHAGLVAKYWLEGMAGVPCSVEVASEYRYRQPVISDDTLFVTISQSGETADTLAALRNAQQSGKIKSLAICNVPERFTHSGFRAGAHDPCRPRDRRGVYQGIYDAACRTHVIDGSAWQSGMVLAPKSNNS